MWKLIKGFHGQKLYLIKKNVRYSNLDYDTWKKKVKPSRLVDVLVLKKRSTLYYYLLLYYLLPTCVSGSPCHSLIWIQLIITYLCFILGEFLYRLIWWARSVRWCCKSVIILMDDKWVSQICNPERWLKTLSCDGLYLETILKLHTENKAQTQSYFTFIIMYMICTSIFITYVHNIMYLLHMYILHNYCCVWYTYIYWPESEVLRYVMSCIDIYLANLCG